MNTRSLACLTLACAAGLFSATASAQARIASRPQPSPPATAGNLGVPNPAGLSLPAPGSVTPALIPGATAPGAAGAATATLNQPLGTGAGGGGVSAVAGGSAGGGTNAMGASGGGSYGAPNAVDIARTFMLADVNHDGNLSRSEALRAGISANFDELDTDHDGELSRMEFVEAFR